MRERVGRCGEAEVEDERWIVVFFLGGGLRFGLKVGIKIKFAENA